MITVDIKSQILLLLYSFAVGAFLSAIYDVFRTVRIVRKKTSRTVLFFEDILFCLISCAVYIIFIFAANMGIPRLYLSLSAVCGYFMWRITLGVLFPKLLVAIYGLFCGIIGTLLYPILKILDILYKSIRIVLVKTTISAKKLKKLFIFEIKGYIIASDIVAKKCFRIR